MRTRITKAIAEDMLVGASIYSTGGGIEYNEQKAAIRDISRKGIVLISIDELGRNDYICTTYGIAPASAKSTDTSLRLKMGLEMFELATKKRFKAIFPGETGIESLILNAASQTGLPLLDADGTGGRSVPEITFDNFFVMGKSILPAVVLTSDSDVNILDGIKEPKRIEKRVRELAIASKYGEAIVFDHHVKVGSAKKLLTLGTLSRSIDTGRFIRNIRKKRNATVSSGRKDSWKIGNGRMRLKSRPEGEYGILRGILLHRGQEWR